MRLLNSLTSWSSPDPHTTGSPSTRSVRMTSTGYDVSVGASSLALALPRDTQHLSQNSSLKRTVCALSQACSHTHTRLELSAHVTRLASPPAPLLPAAPPGTAHRQRRQADAALTLARPAARPLRAALLLLGGRRDLPQAATRRLRHLHGAGQPRAADLGLRYLDLLLRAADAGGALPQPL